MADDMEAVFQALAHRDRRRILDIVKNAPGCCVGDVSANFESSRIAVMKHLRVLEAACLIVSRKEGRQRRLYHNAAPIQMIYDRWTSEYSVLWAARLTQIKYAVEAAALPEPPSTRKRAQRARPKRAAPRRKS